MTKVVLALIPAVWVVAIAILSVQNATPVSLRFLVFRSVELPVGVVLSACAGGAMITTAGLVTWLTPPSRS
ncbi:hypothetical protein [Leptolyngbya sp. PCC 6406]|uniref:hypothetical protein n=1 Tax=Leptolyngbya sp. PCC 6406 TaxID=1173264 RepID=UPI0002AC5815|nr:hypothetical protein [Leptolyngbya sp. PCC 6406]